MINTAEVYLWGTRIGIIHQDDDIYLWHVTVFEFLPFFIFDAGILPHDEIGSIHFTAFSRKIETDLLHLDIYDELPTDLHQQIHNDQTAVFGERMTFPFQSIGAPRLFKSIQSVCSDSVIERTVFEIE